MVDLAGNALKFLGCGEDTKRELIDYYNFICLPMVKPVRKYFMRRGENWCALFVSVVAHIAGYNPEKLPYEVSVYYMVQNAKDLGLYDNRVEPRRNNLIIYDWPNVAGSFNHVGIVLDYNPITKQITVIEGNKNDGVGLRQVNLYSEQIAGFILT